MSSFIVRSVVLYKLTDVAQVLISSTISFFVQNLHIALIMVAVRTSKKPVNFYETTWCNIPEDSHLYICHLLP
jgi:hypothetical protein